MKKQLDSEEGLVVAEEHCRAGHVPGAVHLPLEMLNCRAAEVIPDLQGLVVALPVARSAAGYQVLCSGGLRPPKEGLLFVFRGALKDPLAMEVQVFD